ncbi:VWA domain-containing protein [Candidatus Woesearchaeota archaeon]|nr:VWA domain-containing protein [Candidatus Woesearchaeota archaeon]
MYLQFQNPIYLWFLISIPLFIVTHFWFLKSSRAKAIKFANFEALKRISGQKILTKNMTHLVVRILIMFALIMSVAGATLWHTGQINEVNFVIAIDSSASMTSQDIKPSRFTASKEYAEMFLDELDSQANIGLISFAGSTVIEMPLTEKKSDIKVALKGMQISETGGTDIPGAIITATNLFATESDKGKTVILVSDGVNTLGAFISDSVKQAIRYAKENQVKINTIGLGTNTGPIGYLPEYYNISSNYDADILRTIAQDTDGSYIYVTNTDELKQAYEEYTKNTKEGYIKIDLSFLGLLIALGLLFFEWGIANTIYRRVV